MYLWASTPVLVTVTTFASVVWFNPGTDASSHTFLPASSVFTAVSLLGMLIFPMNAFPWVLSGLLEARVSGRRLSQFLLRAKVFTPPAVSVTPWRHRSHHCGCGCGYSCGCWWCWC